MLKILPQLPLQSILNFKAISEMKPSPLLPSPLLSLSLLFPILSNLSSFLYGLATCKGLICFYYRVSRSHYIGNPAICKYTAVLAPVDFPYNRVVGLGYDPTSCSFKILLHCSPRSDTLWLWCLISTLKFGHHRQRPMACTGSTCYGIFRSSPNLGAFDVNSKSWDSIPPPEGLSYPCRKLGLCIHSCRCLLRTQMWDDRLKMWVLNREMMNWELELGAGAVILVGDTFFISRYKDTVYLSRNKCVPTKIIDIAYNVRSHQFTIIE
ncbi:hypothetical protein AMTRI_Chr11g154240 [Amborella trichopoda]